MKKKGSKKGGKEGSKKGDKKGGKKGDQDLKLKFKEIQTSEPVGVLFIQL